MFLEKSTEINLGGELNPRRILSEAKKPTNQKNINNSKTKMSNLKTKSMKQDVSRLFTELIGTCSDVTSHFQDIHLILK